MKPIFQILAAFFVLTSCNPNRLALLYDAPGENSVSHMRRSIGLAFLELPLVIPVE